MVEVHRRTSFLGSLALLGGVASFALTRIDIPGHHTATIGPLHPPMALAVGAGSLLLALFALVLSSASRRTSTGVPMLAAIVCGIASGLTFSRTYGAMLLPRAQPSPIAVPIVSVPRDSAPVKVVPATTNPTPRAESRPTSIFDDDFKGSASASGAPSADSPSAGPSLADVPSPRSSSASLVRAARLKLDAARHEALRTVESTQAYRGAKATVDAADAELKNARSPHPPGSAELISASQAALEARGRLQRIIAEAEAKDAAVREAGEQLRALESSHQP